MDIIIRNGTIDDFDAIMSCYEIARQYMRSQGNVYQWTNGYPSKDLIIEDIKDGRCYVGTDQYGNIVMVCSFIVGHDATYAVIEGGKWLNDKVYGTVHRLASNGKYHGILKTCVEFCKRKVNDIRLDTHEHNKTMQRAAEKLGFKRCGIITCIDGTPRIAYHLE